MSSSTASRQISRRVVQVDNRIVHYRIAGKGPALLLIHQSPKSSAELIGMIAQLADQFTVIAPDTPGYGFSDPLEEDDAGIDQFVEALVAFIEALGLSKPAIFGSHSGAILGVRLAALYPHKISALIANGILINDAPTRAELVAKYFPDFLPDWSGAHLPKVWSRIRDQHCFYPWYERTAENRIHWPATLQAMHESAMEILLAGEHYKTGYRAVLNYDISPDLTQLTVPALLVVAKTDALVKYVAHYPTLSNTTEVRIVEDFCDIPAATSGFAKRFIGSPTSAVLPWSPYSVSTQKRRLYEHERGTIHYRCAGEPDHPVVLLMHDLGQSSRQYSALIEGLSDSYFVIAIDLPGHGQSDEYATEPVDVAAALSALMTQQPVTSFAMIAIGQSCVYARLLAEGNPEQVNQWLAYLDIQALQAENNGDLATESPPDFTPDLAGSQLVRAWYLVRDQALFSPWHVHSPQTFKTLDMSPAPTVLQQRMLDLLISDKAARTLSRALPDSFFSDLGDDLVSQHIVDLPSNPSDLHMSLRRWLDYAF
ncbi:MAG: alpha/beta fold hydrolase [Alteromonadaceae bacterium]|nr:alpha/beta fold hydrolase [Alteromonadaceae bacterium]